MTTEQRCARLVKSLKADYAFRSVVEQVEELTHSNIDNAEEEFVEFVCHFDLEANGAKEFPPKEQFIFMLASYFSQYLPHDGSLTAEEVLDTWNVIVNIVSGYVELKYE